MKELFEIMQQVKTETTMKRVSAPALAAAIVTERESAIIHVELNIAAVVADADLSATIEEREQAATERGTALAKQIAVAVDDFKAKLMGLGANIDVQFEGCVAASAAVFKDAEQRAKFESDNAAGLAAMREAGTLEA